MTAQILTLIKPEHVRADTDAEYIFSNFQLRIDKIQRANGKCLTSYSIQQYRELNTSRFLIGNAIKYIYVDSEKKLMIYNLQR